MNPKVYIVLTWLLIATVLRSEDDVIQASFTTLSLDKRIEGIAVRNGDKLESIDIFTTTRSELIRYTGPQNIQFFKVSDETGALASPTLTLIGSAVIPDPGTRYLLLFHKIGENQYAIHPMPDDLSDFKAGTFRFLNLAPFTVAIKIGEERLIIQQQDYADLQGNFESGSYYDTVMVTLPEKEEPRRAYEGKLYFSSDNRVLYIIYPKSRGRPGAINFIGIPEAVQTSSIPET